MDICTHDIAASLSRRSVLKGAAAVTTLGLIQGVAATPALAASELGQVGPVPLSGMQVVTLGTAAGPAVRSPRQGIATAVVVDGNVYLIDAGLGVVRQIAKAQVPMRNLRLVLLTHLHSDHIGELPALLLYDWGPPVNGFIEPFLILGAGSAGALPRGARPTTRSQPTPGTKALVDNIIAGYAYDLNIRVFDEGRPPMDDLVERRDIRLPPGLRANRDRLSPDMQPFEIYRDEHVRVLATLVLHPPVFPAFAFRIESAYGSVAISGDTAKCDNMVRLAQDVDLLVHESVFLDYYLDQQPPLPPEFINHLAESHTTPREVGEVATTAGAQRVVLSHLAGVATPEQWAAQLAETYAGPASVGVDGQVITIN